MRARNRQEVTLQEGASLAEFSKAEFYRSKKAQNHPQVAHLRSQRTLTDEEEEELVCEFFLSIADLGKPCTRNWSEA